MRLSFGMRVGTQDVSSGVRPLLQRPAQIRPLLGLQYNRPFYRDSVFLLLLALGPMTWLSMIAFSTFQPLTRHAMLFSAFLRRPLATPVRRIAVPWHHSGVCSAIHGEAADMYWSIPRKSIDISLIHIGPSGQPFHFVVLARVRSFPLFRLRTRSLWIGVSLHRSACFL